MPVTDANSVLQGTSVTQWTKAASRHRYRIVIQKAPNNHYLMVDVSARMVSPDPTVTAVWQIISSSTTKDVLNASVWECRERVPVQACTGIRFKNHSMMAIPVFHSYQTT